MENLVKDKSLDYQQLLQGITVLCKAVKVTYGPQGRNVMVSSDEGPYLTNCGNSVANAVSFQNNVMNVGAKVLKEASNRTKSDVGDGSTMTLILAESLLCDAIKCITSGIPLNEFLSGMDYAIEQVLDYLCNHALIVDRKSDLVFHVASVASNDNSEIAKIIFDTLSQVDENSIVTVEESAANECYFEVKEGFCFDRGYYTSSFITDQINQKSVLEAPYVLVVDGKVDHLSQILGLLNEISQLNASLLIIAEDFSESVVSTLVFNKNNNKLKICLVKSPGLSGRRKELIEDIALFSKTEVFGEHRFRSLEDVQFSDLGHLEKAVIESRQTTLLPTKNTESQSKALHDRIHAIQLLIEDAKSDYEREKLQERLAKLQMQVTVIYVGAPNNFEKKEKLETMKSALQSTLSAIDEGVLPGGGVAYLQAVKHVSAGITGLSDFQLMGANSVFKALKSPFKQLLLNAGYFNPLYEDIINLESDDYGFNIESGVWEHFYVSGIVDPLKILRIALINASSVVKTLITGLIVITKK